MANHPQVETVHSGADKAKLGVSLLLAAAAFVVFYVLSGQGVAVWAQWLALIALLAAAVGVFLTSSWGKEFVGYCRDSVKELKKVVWPTRKEAMQMTLYVFLFVLVMAIFLWAADKLLEWILYSQFLGMK